MESRYLRLIVVHTHRLKRNIAGYDIKHKKQNAKVVVDSIFRKKKQSKVTT